MPLLPPPPLTPPSILLNRGKTNILSVLPPTAPLVSSQFLLNWIPYVQKKILVQDQGNKCLPISTLSGPDGGAKFKKKLDRK